ncbi:putative Thiosulfate sulfurtransferase 16, chloroplastic [Cocos nucifera]|uniref:Putative Thiosulfate sulfurtransferase 16, chloroplastic n=1 Tax=Cocos nucifera TaxID=13894 RepID=A0A8K0IK97_COCNU|nr:putative Thiosulfate sulfurtransferase 16, chloroplastic [Cocos nucifera]
MSDGRGSEAWRKDRGVGGDFVHPVTGRIPFLVTDHSFGIKAVWTPACAFQNGEWSVSSNGSPEIVVPRSVPVRVAHELLQAGHRYLDVRTVDEFNAGHAVGAKNIPYVFKVGSGMTTNPNFLKEVLQTFEEDDEIIIGCESGRRSLMAAAELSSAVSNNSMTGFASVKSKAGNLELTVPYIDEITDVQHEIYFYHGHGFTGITDIAGGYSAWLQNGLPTEQ